MDALASSPRALRAIPRGLLRLRSDAALGERVAAGDESAFAVLYERHHALVLAICIGVLGSRQDAEDATQETFAALAVSLREHPPRALRPWLLRVGRNAAIDLARRRRVHPPLGEASVDPRSLGAGIQQELDSVLAGLRVLPESQRTALLLRELAGHSYDEIATMLNTDRRAVRGLIARARIGLRNYREAIELPCAVVRAALATEPDGRRRDKAVRRHLRACPSCQAHHKALRSDAKALRALAPAPAPVGGLAGGGAAAGLAAKGALAGVTLSQVGAVCAASVCSVGGLVMLYEHGPAHRMMPARAAAPIVRRHPASAGGRSGTAGVADRLEGGVASRAQPGPAPTTRPLANRSANPTKAGLSNRSTWVDRRWSRHAGAVAPRKPSTGNPRPVPTAGGDGSWSSTAPAGTASGRTESGSGGSSSGGQATWSGDTGQRQGITSSGDTGTRQTAWQSPDQASGADSGQAASEFDQQAESPGPSGGSSQPPSPSPEADGSSQTAGGWSGGAGAYTTGATTPPATPGGATGASPDTPPVASGPSGAGTPY